MQCFVVQSSTGKNFVQALWYEVSFQACFRLLSDLFQVMSEPYQRHFTLISNWEVFCADFVVQSSRFSLGPEVLQAVRHAGKALQGPCSMLLTSFSVAYQIFLGFFLALVRFGTEHSPQRFLGVDPGNRFVYDSDCFQTVLNLTLR